jgi:hypothetical protein
MLFVYSQKQQRRKELRDQHEIKILKRHNVIGMTVSGAAIRASWLGKINYTQSLHICIKCKIS